MILLDTNVVSELMRPIPNEQVQQWVSRQVIDTLFLSAITLAEIYFGLMVLPDGQKKQSLYDAFDRLILPVFSGRILPFDAQIAMSYAEIRAHARQKGFAIATADGYIAAIAKFHKLTVATRDVSPFEYAGLSVINPWDMV